jgi:hypothetical protein
VRALLAAGLALAVGAPFQCASDPDPDRTREDSAPEALWHYAERLEERGDGAGRRSALGYLVERYPSSRWARQAERALAAEPAPDDATHGSATPPAPDAP